MNIEVATKLCPICGFQNPYEVRSCLICSYRPDIQCPNCFSWNIDILRNKCNNCQKELPPINIGETIKNI